MALKWSENRYGFECATVGPFQLLAGWGSSAQRYVCEVRPLSDRRVGFQSMADAKQGALAMLLEHMEAVRVCLKPEPAPKGGG